jgi:MFS family permease
MNRKRTQPSATVAAVVGCLALASAMGIGRFSLTPILPLMQHDMGLTFAQGGWLATGNYLGYLAGALICMAFAPRPERAIRWGLVCVAVLTVAMQVSGSPLLWFAFRFFAGVASALVLVGVSAWAMPILACHNKDQWSGFVFAGVGIGIVFAGLVGLAAGLDAWGSGATWIVMGAVGAALAFFLWWPLATNALPARALERVEEKACPALDAGWKPVSRPDARQIKNLDRDDGSRNHHPDPAPTTWSGLPRRAFVAAACYGLFGFGYIIPATFLPALARGYIDDPAVFGWVWPVFGAAAALSTLAAARWGRRLTPWRLWAGAQWVLTAGVLAPVVSLNVVTLLIAAVCVGGTFMLITMAGIREVLRVAGPRASQGIGMMTAAFAVGQIAGPLTVSLLAGSSSAFAAGSMIAAAALVIGNCLLVADSRAQPAQIASSW